MAAFAFFAVPGFAFFATAGFFFAAAFEASVFVAAVGFDAVFVVAVGFDAVFVVAAGCDAVGFVVVALAARTRRVEARCSPPMRVGRVDRRLPSTLGSAALVVFLAFFLADFWVTRFTTECEFSELALRRATVNAGSGRRPL